MEDEEGEKNFFQPLGFRGTFERVIELLGRRFIFFLSSSSLVTLLLLAYSYLNIPTSVDRDFWNREEGYQTQNVYETMDFGDVVFAALSYVFASLANGAIALAVMDLYIHNTLSSAGSIWCMVIEKSMLLLGSSVVLAAIFCVPYLALAIVIFCNMSDTPERDAIMLPIMWGLWCIIVFLAACAMFYVPAIIVIEQTGIWSAIGRSWTLGKGRRLYVMGVLLTFLVTKHVIRRVVVYPVGSGWLRPLLWNVSATLFIAYGGVLVAVVYLNVRIQNEGLTIEIFKEEIATWRPQYDDYVPDDTPYMSMAHDSSNRNGTGFAIGRRSKSKKVSKAVATAVGSPVNLV